jgi:hypothetical protein
MGLHCGILTDISVHIRGRFKAIVIYVAALGLIVFGVCVCVRVRACFRLCQKCFCINPYLALPALSVENYAFAVRPEGLQPILLPILTRLRSREIVFQLPKEAGQFYLL